MSPTFIYPLEFFFLAFYSFVPVFGLDRVRRYNLRFVCIRVPFKPQKFSWVVFIGPQPYSLAFCLVTLYLSGFFKMNQLRFKMCSGAIYSYVYIYSYVCIYKTLLYHQQKQKFSFSPIVIPSMLLFCPIFSRNISANIIYRMMDNGDLCHSPLLTRKACDKRPSP